MRQTQKLLRAAILCVALAAGANFSAAAQETPNKVYTLVEKMPEYLDGGQEGMYTHIRKNIKYPKDALYKDIQGRVFVSFIVDEEGNLTDAKVEKGIGGGCDEEALRVINMLGKWEPATQSGKTVAYRYIVPIKFQLTGKVKKKKKRG